MKALTEPLKQLEDIHLIQADIKAGRLPLLVDGCIDAGKGHLIHCRKIMHAKSLLPAMK